VSVTVGSTTTVIGTLTTDSTGAGTLVLSSNPTGSQQALPSNFPTNIAAGSTIAVGTLSGILAAPTPPTMPGGCGQSSSVNLTAPLVDSVGDATGTATFVSSTSKGVTNTVFSLSVTGATASTTLTVSVTVGGTTTVIGTLTTDSTGAGTLVLATNPTGSEQSLPANFPTNIAAGTVVSVGSLSGTLATTTIVQ
jgi:hypothetical protein